MDAVSPYPAYESLKQIATEEPEWCQPIAVLANIFATKINSKRRLCNIHSISELIDVLECRELLSPANVEHLRELADHCAGTKLQQALLTYAAPKSYLANEGINLYREQRLAEEIRQKLKLGEITAAAAQRSTAALREATQVTAKPITPYPVAFCERKRAAVYKVLAKGLGKYWRDFARELQIRQGDLDVVEEEFPRDLTSRIYKVLHMFEEDECHDHKQDVLILCRALEGCCRKDLRRNVESIMAHD